MKILHITPHLGGGVGKAHAAMSGILAQAAIDQSFLLLEETRDPRYAQIIAEAGARVVTASSFGELADAAGIADIVQFEFWNHPRLFECLARADFPAMRTVFWSHISGLSKPVIQPGLIEAAGKFVFSTQASLALPSIATLSQNAQRNLAVINSGFGFPNAQQRRAMPARTPAIAYLGTADFAKMHPGFFDVIDGLAAHDVRVLVWGEPSPAVVDRASAMRHPERIRFGGHTTDPVAVLAAADIFFYPLQPDHYGTAENALIEAMSLGLAPVVLNNPAEMAIVRHDETGLVARSMEECAVFLNRLLSSSDLRSRISRNAIADVAKTRNPGQSARQFVELWRHLSGEPPRRIDFKAVIGESPADWFLATQQVAGEVSARSENHVSATRSKGTLEHFESVFPDDASLNRLRSSKGFGDR